MARRAENQGNRRPMRRTSSGGWISHSLRRRKHNDRSPINPFVKHCLFLINFIFLLAAIATVYFTTYILVEKDKKVKTAIDFLFDPSCLLCVAGCSCLIISFFGCGGALREKLGFLSCYHTVLSLLLLLEIIVVVFIFVFFFVDGAFAEIGDFEDLFKDAIKDYRNDADVQGSIDSIHDILSCCGASNDDKGFLDWNDNIYFACNDNNTSPEACSVPYSCCKIKEGENINYQCGAGKLRPGADTTDIYINGCLKGLDVTLQDNIWYIGGAIILFFFLQAGLIFFSKGLVGQIEEQMMKW